MGGCGRSCKIPNFLQFPLWEGVLVLTELIFNSFYFGQGVVILKELICFYVGFLQNFFNSLSGVVVLKELIFNSLYFGKVWCLEITDCSQFHMLGGHGGS